jgi:DNA-directed RNA polymerase subunit RPC12/RpoP
MGNALEYCIRKGWFDKNHKLTENGEVALERIMAEQRIVCPRCERRQFMWDDRDYICPDCRYG